MSVRWLTLHLRARHAPAAFAGACLAASSTWLGWLLASDTPQVGAPATAVALALAMVAATQTFAAADESLDRTAAISWPRVRAVHLAVVYAVVVGLFAVSLISPTQFGPITFVLRDAAGLLGLTALAAVLFGPQRAWFVPVAWCVVALPYTQETENSGLQIATWMFQAVDVRTSTVTAIALALVGVAAHLRGRRALPRSEAL